MTKIEYEPDFWLDMDTRQKERKRREAREQWEQGQANANTLWHQQQARKKHEAESYARRVEWEKNRKDNLRLGWTLAGVIAAACVFWLAAHGTPEPLYWVTAPLWVPVLLIGYLLSNIVVTPMMIVIFLLIVIASK